MGKTIDNFQDNLSEWLRRQTRNLLGFARAGSNPAVVVFSKSFLHLNASQYSRAHRTKHVVVVLIHYDSTVNYQPRLYSTSLPKLFSKR